MQFQRLSTEPSTTLPPDPEPSEGLSRFLLDRSHFSVQNNRVKPRAFDPSPVDNCTSVFRIRGLTNSEVWQLAEREVDGIRNRPSLARAEIEVVIVTEAGLTVRG